MSSTSPLAPALADPLDLPTVSGEALLLGAAVVVAGWALGRIVRWTTDRVLRWRGRSRSASATFGLLAQTVVIVLSAATALTLVFPSVKPVNALGGIGALSIAAGIAFQTVLGTCSRGSSFSLGTYSGSVIRSLWVTLRGL